MMKAFSFLTILESLSKKLSILRTKMHSDDLRVDYESITSQLRVSRPFSNCASRRVSHFAAMIFAVLTLSIANIGMAWGAASTSSDGKYATGTITFADFGSMSVTTNYWYNGIKVYSGGSQSASANNSAWSEEVSVPTYISNKTAGKDADKGKWGSEGSGKQYTMSGLAFNTHAIGIHINGKCTVTVVVDKNIGSDTDDASISASVDATAYGTAWTNDTYKTAGTALTVTSTRADKTNYPGRYTLTIPITTDGEKVVKIFCSSGGTGAGKLFCYESITITPAGGGGETPDQPGTGGGDCPESGEIFSWIPKTGLSDADINKGTYDLPGDWLLSVNGGQAQMYVPSNENMRIRGSELAYNSNNSYIHVTLDCPLQVGDVILINSSGNTNDIYISTSTTRPSGDNNAAAYIKQGTEYVLQQNNALVGLKEFYIWRKSSTTQVGSLTITRPTPSTPEPETYSITYECDGATSGCPSNATEQIALPNPLPSAPTKTGYTFVGWYADAEKTIQAVAGATLEENTTLYAKWNVNSYTLTWDVNGGNTLTGDYTTGTVAYGTTITKPADPTREGYTFAGWSPEVAATMPAANTTYTAQWEEIKVASITVNPTTLDLKKGASATITATVSPADALNKTVTWDNTTITTLSSTTGNSITVTGNSNGKDKKLKASAGGKQATIEVSVYYEVQYNSNGGSACTSGKYYDDNNGVTLPEPTKAGYTFAAWYENEGLTQSAGAAGDDYKPSDNITLYAKWTVAKTNPTTTWTVAETAYAGQLVSVSVTTNSDATLTTGSLTTNKGTLVNATVNGQTITATLQVPGNASGDITLTLRTDATENYNASTSTKTITLSECPTNGGGGEETVTLAADGNSKSNTWTNGDFSVICNTDNGAQKTYIKPDPDDTFVFSTPSTETIVSVDIYYSTDNNLSNTATTTIIAPSTSSNSDYFTAATENNKLIVTAKKQCYVFKTVVTYTTTSSGSGEPLETNLAWSTDLSAGVSKQAGTTFTYTASSNNSAGAITYSSSNTSVATVNQTTGEVTTKAAGTAIITATIAESGCYPTKSITYTLTVTSTDTPEPGSYTITYNLGPENWATGYTPASTYTAGTEYTLPTSDNLTSENNFQGWYENNTFEGEAVTSIPANATGDKTYYAKWVYSIKFFEVVDEATDVVNKEFQTQLTGASYPATYTYGVGITLPDLPAKDGYTADGWYSQWCVYNEQKGWVDACKWKALDNEAYGDVNFAVKYTATAEPDPEGCTETTITYNLVTPNNSTPSQSATPAGPITELTGADAIGTATTNTGSINRDFADYSVLYRASNGSDNTNDGVVFTFTVPTGYVFKPSDINTNLMCYGWGQDENNGTQLYKFYGTLSDGATTINGTADPGKKNGANADIEYSDITGKTLSGTVTLRLNAVKVGGEYQSFRIKSPITIVGELCSTQTYTITYDNNGGSGTMESTTNVVAANTFTREGYTFAGWNTAEDGTGTSYAAGDYVSSNLMLYAQWECIEPEFTVSYNKTEYTINDDDASAITVTVTAGNSSEVNYQWYSNTTNDRSSGSAITGATNASYTPSTTIVGTTYYWCEISNSCSTIKTAAIAITVSAAKSTPTVNWTDPTGEIHYGGSGYSITAEVNDEWNGTLLPSMLTAPAGINIKGVTIADKSITATFDVTATFDRSQEKILFCLTLPETNDYTRLVDEHPVDYVNCATGASESYVINVLEKDNANKYGDYYYWLNTAGWIVPNPYSSCNSETKSTTFGDGQKFEYKHNTNSQTVYVRTFHGGVNKVRIYAEFRNPDMTVTGAYKHTDYFKTQNDTYKLKVSDYTIVYNGDANATSMGESGYKYVDVIFKTPLAVNDIIALTFDKSRVRVQGAVLETESGSSLETSLQWSNSIANEATEEKALSDANFTYTAQQTGENSNSAGAITYSSSNPTVATVNAQTGEVSIEAAGTTTITATLAPSGCYAKATITYTLTVSEQTCTIASGTLTASKTEKNTCEEVTLTIDGYESGATIQWWYNGAAIETTPAGITINNNTLTTMLAGTYSVLVTKDCRVRTNSVTITNTTSTATATPLVSEWYVKAGRLTPPIALLKLEGGAVLDGTSWEKGGESSEAPYESNPIYEENGIVYLTGTPPNTNETEADISYTLNFSITNGCDDSPMMVDPITIVHQKNTDKHVLAFVVGNTEKKDEKYVAIGKGFTESIPASQTTNVSLYNEIAKNFDVQPTNIYSTDDEQKIKEYYSRFDIICITDYPNTKETGVNGKSYTDAMGALIDIRPILSMEAWVSKYPNWNDKGVTGDPKSPTTRQYSMLLQCKDHEIFANTSLVSEIVDGEAMYRVTMVDKNQEQYKTLDDTYGDQTPHAEKATTKDKDGKETITGYGYGSNPALQGFTYTSAMSSMLPIGIIDDGAGNNLQVGLERQHEIEARMMVIGVNSYAMERLTTDGEKVIINALKYLMKKNAKDISDCSTYFVGGDETDPTAWSNENNWGPTKTLPNSSQEARILAPCVVSDYTAKVASVKIVTDGTYAPGYGVNGEGFPARGSLTIAPDGALVVGGHIQAATAPNYLEARNTDVKDLIVQSDATGNGALIHGEIGEAIGATVELLSKAYSVKELNQTTGKYKKKKYWQYVALPVQNALAEDAFWGAYTYQYDETQGWIKKGTGENIEEFWGIGLSIDNEVYSGANNATSLTKFTIKGNLALATDRDIDLTRTPDAGAGQNMIGNSWTAPIHLTSMTEDDFENAVATVYIYNTGRDEQASGNEGTASSANGSTQAGQWISIPIAPTKLDPWQGPKVIPSMQAFEVDLADDKTSGVLHLNYDKHVRTIATPEEENLPLRAPKYLGNEPSMIRLRVADSITYTDLYLIEGDQFTDEFDNAWDGKYQPCDGRSATLYAMSPIGDMAVLAQPSVNNTSVVFEPGKKTEYVFTFGYNGDVTYYLNDMQLKTSTEIKEGNEYRFTYNKGDMKNRFLVTRESFDSPNISTGLANIVTDGNGLQVTNPNQENLQVILIDAAGRLCSIYNTAEPMFNIELPATQGVYMINVKGETTNIVRKVVK